MFERKISRNTVLDIVQSGEIICEYPDDKPYPSFLLLGFSNKSPIHIVLAKNHDDGTCYVVTVYCPSSDIWHKHYRRRKDA